MSDNRGISPLGLCHPRYDVNGLIRAFSRATVIRFGYLDNFFGSNTRNVEKVLALGKPTILRIHIINGPGMNNNRTQPHEISYLETTTSLDKKIQQGDRGFLDKFRSRVIAIKQTVSHNVGPLELYISPWLEFMPISKKSFDTLSDIVLQILPDAKIVCNPRNGRGFPDRLLEVHSNNGNPRAHIVDLDGKDIEAIDVPAFMKRFANCHICYGWDVRENGLDGREPWKPPQQRTSWPSSRIFTLYQYFVTPNADRVTSPLDPQDVRGLKIQKVNDGNKQGFTFKLGDGRNYGVALFPKEFKRFKSVVIKKNGKVIDTGSFRGFYHDEGRAIFDFKKHPSTLPDNVVIVADGNGWILEKGQFRND